MLSYTMSVLLSVTYRLFRAASTMISGRLPETDLGVAVIRLSCSKAFRQQLSEAESASGTVSWKMANCAARVPADGARLRGQPETTMICSAVHLVMDRGRLFSITVDLLAKPGHSSVKSSQQLEYTTQLAVHEHPPGLTPHPPLQDAICGKFGKLIVEDSLLSAIPKATILEKTVKYIIAEFMITGLFICLFAYCSM